MSRFYSSPLKKIKPHIPNIRPHKKVKPDPNIEPLKELEKIMKEITRAKAPTIPLRVPILISFMMSPLSNHVGKH